MRERERHSLNKVNVQSFFLTRPERPINKVYGSTCVELWGWWGSLMNTKVHNFCSLDFYFLRRLVLRLPLSHPLILFFSLRESRTSKFAPPATPNMRAWYRRSARNASATLPIDVQPVHNEGHDPPL